jgi:hypothetical protein
MSYRIGSTAAPPSGVLQYATRLLLELKRHTPRGSVPMHAPVKSEV